MNSDACFLLEFGPLRQIGVANMPLVCECWVQGAEWSKSMAELQ